MGELLVREAGFATVLVDRLEDYPQPRTGTAANRAGMARYAIPSDRAFGVPVGVMQKEAKRLGRNHALAAALWGTDALLRRPETMDQRRCRAPSHDLTVLFPPQWSCKTEVRL